MSIPPTVLDYLAGVQGEFRLYTSESSTMVMEAAANEGIPPEQLVLAMLIKHRGEPLMVIVGADQELDSELLAERIGAEPELCSSEECAELCAGSNSEWLPPLPATFGLQAISTIEFNKQGKVFFPAGAVGQFMQTSGSVLESLLKGSSPDELRPAVFQNESALSLAPAIRIDPDDGKAGDLPVKPALAEEIARVRDNPYSQPSELVAVVQQDANLSAQLIRYAATSLFESKERVTSLEQAVTQVLGLDFAFDLGFGLALSNGVASLEQDIQHKGYWERALHSAMLTHLLCNSIDYYYRPVSGFAFLAGLLPNLGQLLMMQRYQGYQQRLATEQACSPGLSLLELEHHLFGVDHVQLGMNLMEKWSMPREVILAAQHHHDSICHGEYAIYANLVILANRLLTRHGLGDAVSSELPDELLQAVELDHVRAENALTTVMLTGTEGLTLKTGRMAA